jgi:hypothetical protein
MCVKVNGIPVPVRNIDFVAVLSCSTNAQEYRYIPDRLYVLRKMIMQP